MIKKGDQDGGAAEHREGTWTRLGAIAGIASAIIAVVAIMLTTGGGAQSSEAPPSATTPPNAPTPSPVVTATSSPQAGPPGPAAISASITRFEIVPDDFQKTGPSTFAAYRNNRLDFSYEFIIQSAGDDIGPCTISSTITNLVTKEVITPGEARCPSLSFFIKRTLQVGTYRIDAKVYAPDIDANATTSYEFTISP